MKYRIVTATAETERGFFHNTPLGQSLSSWMPDYVDLRLFSENSLELPFLYNLAVDECVDNPAVLIFASEDVFLLDFYWPARIFAGLEHFDVIAVAGSTDVRPLQTSWRDELRNNEGDASPLSGAIAHGEKAGLGEVEIYGPPGQRVKLFESSFFVVPSETLIANQIAFDESFMSPIWELDLARQMAQAELKMGTWDLAIQVRTAPIVNQLNHSAFSEYFAKWSE